jgi:hypothetical protein
VRIAALLAHATGLPFPSTREAGPPHPLLERLQSQGAQALTSGAVQPPPAADRCFALSGWHFAGFRGSNVNIN